MYHKITPWRCQSFVATSYLENIWKHLNNRRPGPAASLSQTCPRSAKRSVGPSLRRAATWANCDHQAGQNPRGKNQEMEQDGGYIDIERISSWDHYWDQWESEHCHWHVGLLRDSFHKAWGSLRFLCLSLIIPVWQARLSFTEVLVDR